MQITLFYPPLVAWVALSLCVLLSPLQAQDLYFTLLNGDCDGDNEVTLFDFGIVVNAMGATPNDPNWDPCADLDGDLEVTLFDYGIVVRNFGAVGAEPFDPALPRRPMPSVGYSVWVTISLQDWQGAQKTVRVEAQREDDPYHIVYWADIPTGGSYQLYLPQSGLWVLKVSEGTHFLNSEQGAKRRYSPGDLISIHVVYPVEERGEQKNQFTDQVPEATPIPLYVRVTDYDNVEYHSRNGERAFSNKEPGLHLVTYWTVEEGGGFVWPFPLWFGTLYFPDKLREDESYRDVRLGCTVVDTTADESRKDENITIHVNLRIIKKPTINAMMCAAIREVGGEPIGNVPVSSGSAAEDKVRLRFSLSVRVPSAEWSLKRILWQLPWPGTVQADGSFLTDIIASEEQHRRIEVVATAEFERPVLGSLPPSTEPFSDTKKMSFPVVFMKNTLDEVQDTSRGRSISGTFDPSNWFDNRPRHWGAVIPQFNEEDTNLEGRFVVYFARRPFPNLPAQSLAIFDWRGEYGVVRNDVKYRGRIYLFEEPTLEYHDGFPAASKHGLLAGGIDRVAVNIAHEFAHRELFLRSWWGFTDNYIGRPNGWYPGDPRLGFDSDGDKISDRYEDAHAPEYFFNKDSAFAVEHWWLTGKRDINLEGETEIDDEMYAQLWGEWRKCSIGGLDRVDWSWGGRQCY